jgi:hypothetical protein
VPKGVGGAVTALQPAVRGGKDREPFLQRAGTFVLALVIFSVPFLAIMLYLRGMVWLSENFTPWLLNAASIDCDICVFVFLPLCIFKRTRALAGIGFTLSSLVFGAALFLFSCTVAFGNWGYVGLLVGLCLGFVGVIPVAWLAALSHGLWAAGWLITAGVLLNSLGAYLLSPRHVPEPESLLDH